MLPETPQLDSRSIEGIVLDMDGVLWRGGSALPGLNALFDWLRATDFAYVLATNNSSRRPEAQRDKLRAFGLDIPVDRVLSAALVCAEQMARRDPPGTPIFVVGEDGLHVALRDRGFQILNPLLGQGKSLDGKAEIVVAGIDREFDYAKLAEAALHIQRGARFVASNPDPSYPAEDGLLPGAGSIQAAIQAVTGIAPEVMGKPHRPIFEAAASRLQTPLHRVAMVGDRLDTDIQGANRAGLKSVLLLSGVTRPEAIEAEIERVGADARPDLVLSGLPELLRWLELR